MREMHRTHTTGKHGGGKVRFGGRIPANRTDDFYDNLEGGFHTNRHSSFTHKVRGKGYGAPSGKWVSAWLRKQVGRPWNDVYSEFCQCFDSRTYRGYYFRRFYIYGYGDVDQRTFMGDDGEVYTYDGYSPRCVGEVREYYSGYYMYTRPFNKADGLYVHPVTGLLCYRELDYDERSGIVRWKKDGITSIPLEDGSRYSLLECGRSPKTKFKAWFHIYEDVKHYEYFCPLSERDLDWYRREVEKANDPQTEYERLTLRRQYVGMTVKQVLEYNGYFVRNSHGIPVWGKMQKGTDRTYVQRSCNKQQLQEIREYLKKHSG